MHSLADLIGLVLLAAAWLAVSLTLRASLRRETVSGPAGSAAMPRSGATPGSGLVSQPTGHL